MKHRAVLTVLVGASILLGAAFATVTAETAPVAGKAQKTACPIAVPDAVAVECGRLTVPENYEVADGATVRLPYIILHSRNARHAPDPLLFTVGGPGYSSLDSVWSFVHSPLLDDRDVIVFEQRGNRYADPALMCDRSLLSEAAPGQTPCLDAIRANGIDITQYNVATLARDISSLREALGYAQWNLYGTSFSTSLMLLAMETDPLGTRSAILQSVKPPHETTFAHEADSPLRAIEQMFHDCAADSPCAAAYPNLEAQFYSVIRRLHEAPVEVAVTSALDGEEVSLQIGSDAFIDWILIDNYYRPAFPPFGTAYLPLLISEVYRGNTAPLAIAAQSYWNGMVENPNWALGLLFAISCQQDLPAAGGNRPAADSAAMAKLEGFARSSGQRAICAAWDLTPLPPAATDYVRSDVPALVLAGAYDPVTPPSWSQTTAEHLPNSTYVEFAGQGHNVTVDNPCADALQVAFLNNPTAPLDVACANTAARPSFVLPEDVFIAPGLAQSGRDVSIGDPRRGIGWIETITVGSLAGMSLLLVTFLGFGLAWLIRGRGREAARDKSVLVAYVLAWLVILPAIALPLLTTRLNQAYLGRNDLLYSLGPSRDFLPAVILAWLAPLTGLTILALAAITLWAWLTGHWPRAFRFVATLVVVCSLPFVLLCIRWGLFGMLV